MIQNLLLASIISTKQIIKLFGVNIFMPVINFPCLTILLFYEFRTFWIFDQFRGLFKEISNKIGDLALRIKGTEKTQMVK